MLNLIAYLAVYLMEHFMAFHIAYLIAILIVYLMVNLVCSFLIRLYATKLCQPSQLSHHSVVSPAAWAAQ